MRCECVSVRKKLLSYKNFIQQKYEIKNFKHRVETSSHFINYRQAKQKQENSHQFSHRKTTSRPASRASTGNFSENDSITNVSRLSQYKQILETGNLQLEIFSPETSRFQSTTDICSFNFSQSYLNKSVEMEQSNRKSNDGMNIKDSEPTHSQNFKPSGSNASPSIPQFLVRSRPVSSASRPFHFQSQNQNQIAGQNSSNSKSTNINNSTTNHPSVPPDDTCSYNELLHRHYTKIYEKKVKHSYRNFEILSPKSMRSLGSSLNTTNFMSRSNSSLSGFNTTLLEGWREVETPRDLIKKSLANKLNKRINSPFCHIVSERYTV